MRVKSIISWLDNMSVGVPDIDEEHKSMIADISGLYASRKDKSGEAMLQHISSLVRNTVAHFSTEERFMEKIKYGDLENHKIVHGGFVDQIKDLETAMTKDPLFHPTDAALNAIARWLFNHILTEDKDYAIYAARRDEELATEVTTAP